MLLIEIRNLKSEYLKIRIPSNIKFQASFEIAIVNDTIRQGIYISNDFHTVTWSHESKFHSFFRSQSSFLWQS